MLQRRSAVRAAFLRLANGTSQRPAHPRSNVMTLLGTCLQSTGARAPESSVRDNKKTKALISNVRDGPNYEKKKQKNRTRFDEQSIMMRPATRWYAEIKSQFYL